MTKHAQSTSPVLVDESDLSRAWGKAVLHVLDHPGPEISPLILSVSDFDEDGALSALMAFTRKLSGASERSRVTYERQLSVDAIIPSVRCDATR